MTSTQSSSTEPQTTSDTEKEECPAGQAQPPTEMSQPLVQPKHPSWKRAAAQLRRITTLVVALIAASVLAVSLHQQGEASTEHPPESAGQETAEQSASAAPGTSSPAASPQTYAATELDRKAQLYTLKAKRTRRAQIANVSAVASATNARSTPGEIIVDAAGDDPHDGHDLAQSFGASSEFADLTQAVGSFEDHGYSLSITLRDLSTGRCLYYQPDEYYYSASSIKGPFAIAGYQLEVDGGLVDASVADPIARRALVYSDNDAYLQLRNLFDADYFAEWLAMAEVSPGAYDTLSELAGIHYPHLSTNQMAAMWTYAYDYLSSGGNSAETLVSYLRQREVSPIKDAVGDTSDSWSKAGWIDIYSGDDVEPATWDAGVVLAPSGTYVVAIASDAPADLSALGSVAAAVDEAHAALVR